MNQSWMGWLLLAPVMEEVVFRGGLHAALLKGAAGVGLRRIGGVNLLVAAAFALAHALTRSPALGLATIPMALAIGWVFERTGRLRHCVLIHAACNAAWFAWSGALTAPGA